jgi:hypothetical protein
MYDFGVVLLVLTRRLPTKAGRFRGIDVGGAKSAEEKTCDLPNAKTYDVVQSQQAKNPDSAIVFEATGGSPLLERYADSYQGSGLADIVKYRHLFWELDSLGPDWVVHQSSPSGDVPFSGMHFATLWERGEGMLVAEPSVTIRGRRAWKKNGVACAWLGSLPASFYSGTLYDNSAAAIIPKSKAHLASLWCFMSSPDYLTAIRKINQKTQVANATLVKVPFDLAHWQQVASEKYPYGLPKPYSDDPTQWIFHGHPATSSDALQVAVARLLGYRWPAELDDQMELAEDARQWVNRSSQLTTLADNDGIVCIPAVGTEQPAEDRLLNLLHTAYEEGRAVEQQFQEKLEAGDTDDSLTVALLQREWQPELPGSFNDWVSKLLEAADHKGKTLGSWLREKFFTQHCKLFHHRPFIWHIWDGLRDGFSVLVNYHRLDNKLLKALIYTYLNDWITRQKQDKAASVDGSEEKLAAAQGLKERMELILEGEAPLDIFVRWKPLEEQPIGWNPDLNDGVRLNIRPWLTVGDVGKRGAGVLRDKPNIKWTKDRGKDVESAPWYHLGPEYKGKEGDRINDHHLTLAEKAAARREAE